jgi:hypothetical protein
LFDYDLRALTRALLLASLAGCSGTITPEEELRAREAGLPGGGRDGGSVDDITMADLPRVVLGELPRVVLSEIMYHPVEEKADEDNHEFIELHNRSRQSIPLAGWTLSGKKGLHYVFPSDASIAPGGYLVVAKNRKSLARLARYGLVEAGLLGDYRGQLDNGGDVVSLCDPARDECDAVQYDDGLPWPIAADELGVGEDWLAGADRPLSRHQYLGRSLERKSVDFPSAAPANWEASALDGATPGKANSVAGPVVPIIEEQGATPEGGSGAIIRSNQNAIIRARFSDFSTIEGAEVESFVEDVTKSVVPTTRTAMTSQGNGVYTVALAPQKDGSRISTAVTTTT